MSITKFIESICVQTAVYWGNPVEDGYGGRTYDDPVEIKVRWDTKIQIIKDDMGREVITDTRILTPENLDYHGMLWLGDFDDLDDTVADDSIDVDSGQYYPDPSQLEKAYEIVAKSRVSMPFSTTEFVNTVYLNTRNK